MFFGMIRQSCGGSDHPTANQFLYAYRLLSANSLIKPPRRANVTGVPVQTLAPLKSVLHKTTASQASVGLIEERLDRLLYDDETAEENAADVVAMVDHDYYTSEPETCILQYLGGYVAHKLRKFTSCEECLQVMVDNEHVTADAKLIELKTRGGLQIPSWPLTLLLTFLEKCVQKHSNKLHVDIYQKILDETLSSDKLASVTIGCEAHRSSLTARCVHFYIVIRVYFLRKACNRNRNNNQQKQKLSKLSKLT
jgi:hypothetical protein